ncbi:hypothetical protein CRE_31332 [Caenorhabditis remanei]|uniref:Uncharacterized protein n=1 Tax=Caenorhabditis remanei TaxID=31234 RepID=E3MY86_CAERE|nr:hypothetical protein CRE_31332 [Caenorhabditis remanei]
MVSGGFRPLDAQTTAAKAYPNHDKRQLKSLLPISSTMFNQVLQKDLPTIESKLFEAMEKAGWITAFLLFQMCGMQLPRDDDKYQADGAEVLNNLLPDDIRVFGMRRTMAYKPAVLDYFPLSDHSDMMVDIKLA